MARFLILAGAHLEARYCHGRTALHSVVATLHTEATAVLLAHAPGVDAMDDSEQTPLQAAIQYNNEYAVELLLEAGAGLELTTRFAPTPLLFAIGLRRASIVGRLLTAGADVRTAFGTASCALIRAAQLADPKLICQLLAYEDVRRDIHAVEAGSRRTALHIIASTAMGHTDAAVRDLLAAGADINAVDSTFSTPLHAAAKAGSAYNTNCLLVHGAKKDWRNDAGKTACDLAIAKKHKEVVAVLGGTVNRKRWFRRS